MKCFNKNLYMYNNIKKLVLQLTNNVYSVRVIDSLIIIIACFLGDKAGSKFITICDYIKYLLLNFCI